MARPGDFLRCRCLLAYVVDTGLGRTGQRTERVRCVTPKWDFSVLSRGALVTDRDGRAPGPGPRGGRWGRGFLFRPPAAPPTPGATCTLAVAFANLGLQSFHPAPSGAGRVVIQGTQPQRAARAASLPPLTTGCDEAGGGRRPPPPGPGAGDSKATGRASPPPPATRCQTVGLHSRLGHRAQEQSERLPTPGAKARSPSDCPRHQAFSAPAFKPQESLSGAGRRALWDVTRRKDAMAPGGGAWSARRCSRLLHDAVVPS